MKCEEFRVATATSGYLPPAMSDPRHSHLRCCELCRHWLDDARLTSTLRLLPIAEPDQDFADRVIGRAISAATGGGARHDELMVAEAPGVSGHKRRLTARLASGGALAATLLLAVLLTAGQVPAPGTPQPESRLVNVVIDAQVPRPNATLTLFLADDLELDGYAGRRRIEWQTDLAQGRNLLSLPVQVRSGSPSEMRLAVSYEDDDARQEMRIPVDAG